MMAGFRRLRDTADNKLTEPGKYYGEDEGQSKGRGIGANETAAHSTGIGLRERVSSDTVLR
jgi:hypothetical protein